MTCELYPSLCKYDLSTQIINIWSYNTVWNFPVPFSDNKCPPFCWLWWFGSPSKDSPFVLKATTWACSPLIWHIYILWGSQKFTIPLVPKKSVKSIFFTPIPRLVPRWRSCQFKDVFGAKIDVILNDVITRDQIVFRVGNIEFWNLHKILTKKHVLYCFVHKNPTKIQSAAH